MPTNRLTEEKSPYLLQHAHNPVDWYPWGDEAFAKAKQEDKPIFLSVGYSTCHWCHVMERESFESAEVAEVLNRYFVPIKVDREERPDVDRIYMMFVQLTTGGGGWPMSVWLTPDREPFYGGTYFPPDSRYGRPGFRALLEYLAEAWKNDRAKILESGRGALAGIEKYLNRRSSVGTLDVTKAVETGFQHFRRTYDAALGGFGDAPKFPRPSIYQFLLRYAAKSGNADARNMVLHTLQQMARGGMYDQIGGGFHRYSVDERWFVPHFEKMLYDQAQLVMSYVDAFQLTGDPFYSTIAIETLDYVLRDMRDADGAFYSAEDADSVADPSEPHEKREGAFYVWRYSEIEEVISEPDRSYFRYFYGMIDRGNVDNDPHQEFVEQNILYEAHSLKETADHFQLDLTTLQHSLANSRKKLLGLRSRRVRPHLDDKILTSWNGLMISAFARAAQVMEDQRSAAAAVAATEFILNRMMRSDGVLLRRYRAGSADIPGFLDDYAFFIQALLDLYETVFDIQYLDMAVQLMRKQIELFYDAESGDFYSSTANDPSLVLRLRDDYDGAEPSGNSVSLMNLLRLSHLTGQSEFREMSEKMALAFQSQAESQPTAVPQLLAAFLFLQGPVREIVFVEGQDRGELAPFLRTLNSRYLPNRVVLSIHDETSRARFSSWLPNVADMQPLHGRTTAYVCQNFACQLPTADVAQFGQLLQ